MTQNSHVVPAFVAALAVLATALVVGGCSGGYSDTTRDARHALDLGQPEVALAGLNAHLGVEDSSGVPEDTTGDTALAIMDRSMVLQMVEDYPNSSRDLEIADREIQMLDFSDSGGADIARYLFTDDTGEYAAPAYEKLMINTMNMVNYLGRDDLNGARVEARRLAVMQRYISQSEGEAAAFLGASSYLAGFIFEMSGDADEAMRWYDEALKRQGYQSLAEPIQRLSGRTSYRSPAITELLGRMPACATEDCSPGPGADVLVIISHGRIAPKIAQRINIGRALVFAAPFLAISNVSAARNLAAQGLVTYVNYPTLGETTQTWGPAAITMDGSPLPLEDALALEVEARRAYDAIKGQVMASAITRMITRVAAGQIARAAAGGGTAGAIASIGTQVAMNAVDTPDTRSWSMLPARLTVGRVRVPAGHHTYRVEAGGAIATRELTLEEGGYGVVVLTSLR